MLSLPKLLVLLAVGGLVFGILALAGRGRRKSPRPVGKARKREAEKAPPGVEDLTECPVCGVYASGACERPDCPRNPRAAA
ncbi:hypothetical protein [Futiania mangrovi]|uniref:Uncharacterized protein n=1 Tax=Futiania mangrovi TaxID=2959716 RepID=A0A9J6PNB0_9PROT|nr:hypothetical protein [Futiania mangrovii]MCP1337554.1 hypothetical protein [Futiania mangrovii]